MTVLFTYLKVPPASGDLRLFNRQPRNQMNRYHPPNAAFSLRHIRELPRSGNQKLNRPGFTGGANS